MSVHQMMAGYWASRTLMTAVRLGLFDRLARGPATREEVAKALSLNPDGAGRLLTALLSLGYLTSDGQRYANAPQTEATLVSGRPTYVGGIANHHINQLWPVWSHLETAVREGRSVTREALGESDPFSALLRNPRSATEWLEGMHAGALGLAEDLLLSHDFRLHRHLVDVGGGSATVSMQIAAAHPHLQVSVLERDEVCSILPRWLTARGAKGRVRPHPGDFFRPETFPAKADVMVLSRVLHDWNDQKALAIVQACHRALAPNGVLLVLEAMLDPQAPSAFAALSNLMMLALTDGGRERNSAEYEALLRQGGFDRTASVRTPKGLGVIKGIKGPA